MVYWENVSVKPTSINDNIGTQRKPDERITILIITLCLCTNTLIKPKRVAFYFLKTNYLIELCVT